MVALSEAVVVTTEALAQAVRLNVGDKIPIRVIPDGIETPALLEKIHSRLDQALKHQGRRFSQKIAQNMQRALSVIRESRFTAWVPLIERVVKRIKKEMHWKPLAKKSYHYFNALGNFLSAIFHKKFYFAAHNSSPSVPDIKRILWFGNHGAPYARFGMLDLLEIRDTLAQIAMEFNVELVVVSNLSDKFQDNIWPLAIQTRYVEWSHAALDKELSQASVVVIPNTLDPFSLCKSANRAVLALTAGIPVVATFTPVLSPLLGCIVVDDFLGGLRTYLSNGSRAGSDVCRGQQIIQNQFGQKAIATEWLKVLLLVRSTPFQVTQPITADLIVVLHLTQDLDLALPILEIAKTRQTRVVACCSVSLVNKSPRVMDILTEADIQVWVLPDDESSPPRFCFPDGAKALLTIAESNLGPHRFSRRITEQAKAAGLITATLQHGFENVGLTYDDEIHPINGIDISADKIYLWGNLHTLHPKVAMDRREKCVPVGCPKVLRATKADLSELLPADQIVIGVFENLHWHRYSDEYRDFFIRGVISIAEQFSHITFLIKPHHAGMWLTKQKKYEALSLRNLIVANPTDSQWEPYTASALLWRMEAVISSPSTVVLDAARVGLPVAVVAANLLLDNYSPLEKIQRPSDWNEFVDLVTKPDLKNCLAELSQRFVGRAILSGNGAERIFDDLCSGIQ